MGVQVSQDGKVAMIHAVGAVEVKERVAVDTGTYVGVFWNGSFPTASTNCGGGPSCQVHGSTCVCSNVIVDTVQVFTQVPTIDDIFEELHIGSSDPGLFDAGTYTLCSAPICSSQNYNIFSTTPVTNDADIANAFDESTIFEVPLKSGAQFLSNTKSVVYVDGYNFRNPPLFNSPVDPTQRDALYETDAILRQYVEHPNTAPFIATKLINLLITSNPSPLYVQTVSESFTTGTYSKGGQTFGTGEYGDMSATIAAIMLDREARSTTLDDDANHGRAREPLLKIMHILRSMNLSTKSGFIREVDMINLIERGIGQESFYAPSVFGFFLAEYQPVGPVLNKGLVAPEAQLFDAPKLISFLNGAFSLPRYGLSDCMWWQGFGNENARYWITDTPDSGSYDCNISETQTEVPLTLRYKPPSWGGDA
jgi:hypothetical protein